MPVPSRGSRREALTGGAWLPVQFVGGRLPHRVTAPGQTPQPARRPEVWAIVVGIGDYIHPAIPDSRTAGRDAQTVRQWLRRAGWDDRHQLLLTDSGSTDPGDPRAPAPSIRPLKP